MRFSCIEFALITGLQFGPYPDIDVDSHRLKDLYFGQKAAPTLDDIDLAFFALDFTSIDDVDAVKLTLYYILERVLIGRAGRYLADLWLMSIVDDLDVFNQYPWGSVSWRYTYRSLSRALRGQASQYRFKKAEAEADGKTYSTKYNLDGFPLAFQIWIYEVLPSVGREFARCTNQRLPRMLRWMATKKNIRNGMITTHVLSPSTPLVVLRQIEPTDDERTQPYYTQVVGIVGVDEGDYGGAILMDDPTPSDTRHMDDAADISPPVAPGTDELSTPPAPAVDHTVTSSLTPLKPKKRSRPRRPSRQTEYREELFTDEPLRQATNTQPHRYDIAQHLTQLRDDFQAFSMRQDEAAQRQQDSIRQLIDQIQGILRPDVSQLDIIQVDTAGVASVRGFDAPPLDDQSRYGRVYQKSKSGRPPYTNPFKQRMIEQPRSWSQYGPAYHIRPLEPVPIDIYSQFLRWVATPMAYTEGETCRLTPTWISVVFEAGRWLEDDTALQVTYRGYLSRTLAEGTFYPNSGIEAFVTRRHSRLHRDWIQVDVVYLPITLGGNHWVACEIHLRWRAITVYDSLPSAHGDDVLDTAIQPLCIYIPYLLDQTGFYRYRTDVIQSLEAFTYIRPIEGIPHQRSDSGDCGIFTCMFIQHLGLGLPLCFGPEDSELMQTRVAVDLWAGQLL
ncbi:Phospholipase-like protein [Melia azedarach]|uniref:Phospholipase-like protein n=1 Tax=Melia azedarach TaxID=155640 RepID=A0ACC1XPL3_MELAZ|nr:Phospholipase-like protein [Melia azedarach]